MATPVAPAGGGRHRTAGVTSVPRHLGLPSLQPMPDTDDLPGLQAVIQGQFLQQQFAETQVTGALTELQQAAVYSTEIRDNFASILESLKEATDHTPDIAREAVRAATDEARNLSRYDDQGYLRDTGRSSPTTRPRVEGMSPTTRTPFGDISYQEGRDMFSQGLAPGIRTIGQRASGATARWLSEHQPYSGAHMPEGQTSMGARVVGKMTGALGAVGEGGGIAGGLSGAGLGGLVRFAGPVGVGVGLATAGINFAESQRAQNLYYQQISGESNASGFAERGREFLHGLSGIGTMGIGAAREQFRAVSATGLTGEGRGEALDFMEDLYMRYGMQTADSIALVEQAVKSGTFSLASLTSAIDSVSETAADAGHNVGEAQKNFAALLETITTQVSAGTTAPQTAAALAVVSDTLSQSSLKDVSITGMLTGTNINMAATSLGRDPNRLQQRVVAGSINAQASVLKAGLQAFLDALIPKDLQQPMRDWLEANVPNEVPTPEDAQRMAAAFPQVTFNVQAIISLAATFGISGVTEVNALQTVASVLKGTLTPDLTAQVPGGAAAPAPTLASDPGLFQLGEYGGVDPANDAIAAQREQFLTGLGYDPSTDLQGKSVPSTTGRSAQVETDEQKAVEKYYLWEQQNGPNPVLRDLFSKEKLADTLGRTFDLMVNGEWVRGLSIDEVMANPAYVEALMLASAHSTTATGAESNPAYGVTPMGGGGGRSASILTLPQDLARSTAATLGQFEGQQIDVTVRVTDDRVMPGDVTIEQRRGQPSPPDRAGTYDPNQRSRTRRQ